MFVECENEESSRDYKIEIGEKSDQKDRKYRIEELGCLELGLDTRRKRS